MVKSEANTKYKKAPQAPRRFKSAYMFFSTEKHGQIRKDLNEKLQTTEVAKMVSEAWKSLTAEERKQWDEMARRDKARYEVEKNMYTGPWKVPAKKRTQKDPAAPKRPMSAFLSFSNSKRAMVKAQNPDIGNAEVSRTLALMWKEAPEGERNEHIQREFRLRQEYKLAIAEWRKIADRELDDIRMKREQMAMRTVDAGEIVDEQGNDRSRMPPPGPNGVNTLGFATGGSNSAYGAVPQNSGYMDQYQYQDQYQHYGHPYGQFHGQYSHHANYPQHQNSQQQQQQHQHRRQDEDDGSDLHNHNHYAKTKAHHTVLTNAVGRVHPPIYAAQAPPYGAPGSGGQNALVHASSSPYGQHDGSYPVAHPGAYDETTDAHPSNSMVAAPSPYPFPTQEGYAMQAQYSYEYGHPVPPQAHDSMYDSATYYNSYYHHTQDSMTPPTWAAAGTSGEYYSSETAHYPVGLPATAPRGTGSAGQPRPSPYDAN